MLFGTDIEGAALIMRPSMDTRTGFDQIGRRFRKRLPTISCSALGYGGQMNFGILAIIATLIEAVTMAPAHRRGHPLAATVRVLATLRQFLREGTPWRSLRATVGQASGATLRRRFRKWNEDQVLAKVHALLVAMLRGDPTLLLDSCSVRAKRGGDLTGPNPTDRGKRGTKYHVATTGNGIPVACTATAANVNDTTMFERLFLSAFAVMSKIRTVYADKGYDAERHRVLCQQFSVEPHIHKRGSPTGSGLGKLRWPVERTNAWLLENRRLALRYDRLGFIIQTLLQAACIFLVARRVTQQL